MLPPEKRPMPALMLLHDAVGGDANTFWWFWLLVAGGFIVLIAYLVGRIGPRGPWVR
jgi:hypothetical protein